MKHKITEWEYQTDRYHLIVMFTDMGHRVGYLGMSEKEYDVVNVDDIYVHGGVTYTGTLGLENGLLYIGFDCAHYNDGTDLETLKLHFPDSHMISSGFVMSGKVRSLNFAIHEVFNILKSIQPNKIKLIDDDLLDRDDIIITYCTENDNWDFYYRWITKGILVKEELLFLKLHGLD